MDMDPKTKEEMEKKLKAGWIQTRMMIEVLAVNEDTAKSSLEKHIQQLEKEKKTLLYKKEFKEIKKIENPRPNIPEAFSNIVELELLAADFDTMVYLVMNYGPSATEILAPERLTLDQGEAQGVLNSIADMLHKFAQQGIGGIVIRS